MPYLRLHRAVDAAPDSLRIPASCRGLPGRDDPGRLGRDSTPLSLPNFDGGDSDSRDAVAEIERAFDVVDHRLANLRALVDQFGLGDDDGPRAA